MASDIFKIDGSFDWSGGVDSNAVTTIRSQLVPNGLKRDQLAWLNNATVRDGGITQRTGWHAIADFHPGNAIYQGGFLYEPPTGEPFLIFAVGGRIYKVTLAGAVTDLSAAFGLTMPADIDQFFFCQGEEFLIIQTGDYVTLPLFFDGSTMRRSLGLPAGQIPAASCMDYYMNRLWYAQGRTVSAGDIVRGPSGSAPYDRRDSILRVTENLVCVGGDGFTVPDNAGNIRALKHAANLNTQLGQGQLYIFTRKAVYGLTVPVTRTDWTNANANNQPLMTVVQLVNGAVNDRSVVPINGDLYFQSLEPSIRSLNIAIRYFEQAGNISISAEEDRLIQFNDRNLMRLSSGIQFNNRLLQAMLPKQLPGGVVHQALVPLDFLPISTAGRQTPTPVYEGMYEGLDFLQLFNADFGGRERAFAAVIERQDASFSLWELTDNERFENGDNRVVWQIEFPAFTWGKEYELKRLIGGEMWYDKLYGEVMFNMEYRPDSDPCWYPWAQWKDCTARNSCEDVHNPVCYPIDQYRESYRAMRSLPNPTAPCASAMGRPSNIGFQIQPRLTIKGWCRIRGLLLFGAEVERKTYQNLVC